MTYYLWAPSDPLASSLTLFSTVPRDITRCTGAEEILNMVLPHELSYAPNRDGRDRGTSSFGRRAMFTVFTPLPDTGRAIGAPTMKLLILEVPKIG